jgi:hypothetical protein
LEIRIAWTRSSIHFTPMFVARFGLLLRVGRSESFVSCLGLFGIEFLDFTASKWEQHGGCCMADDTFLNDACQKWLCAQDVNCYYEVRETQNSCLYDYWKRYYPTLNWGIDCHVRGRDKNESTREPCRD